MMEFKNMRRLKMTYSVLAALLMGCAAEASHEGDGGLVPIVLTTSVRPQATTRAATALTSSQLPANELFNVYFANGATTVSNVTYEAVGDGTTTLATGSSQPYFTLGGSSTTVHAYYPSSVTNSAGMTTFTVQGDQSSDANYLASDLMYATTTLSKRGTAVTGLLTFRHLMTKLVVSLSLGQGITKVSAVNIVGGFKTIGLGTRPGITLGGLSHALSAGGDVIKMHGETSADVSFAALLPPQTIDGALLQVVTDKGTATYSVTDKAFVSGGTYTYRVIVQAVDIGLTTAVTNWSEDLNLPTVNNGSDNIVAQTVKGVDLGLSVLWANMNIGATAETDFGGYYAWGETAPKNSYTWDTYRYGSSQETLTKYYSGDGKTTLEATDDAATVNWGNGWRTPTYAEMKELIDTKGNGKCTWEWIENYVTGINGYLVTSTETGTAGNHIFIPAGGYCMGTTKSNNKGKQGVYWTANVGSAYPNRRTDAQIPHPNSTSTLSYYEDEPWVGCMVRAVVPKGIQAVDLGLSVKWADMNIGATSETDTGLYFQWGNPVGHAAGESFSYNWGNYLWGTNTNITKYNASDGKTKLEDGDEMAKVNLGNGWRMPTFAELEELSNGCNWTYYADYKGSGMNGYLVSGKKAGYENNSIFIPIVNINGGNQVSGGNYTYIWSSEVNQSGTYSEAKRIRISEIEGGAPGGRNLSSSARSNGFTVRAVIK